MRKLLLFAMGAMVSMASFAQEEDVTNLIQNAGFDEDLTWQADGSKKEIVENDYDLSINKYKKTEDKPVEYPPTVEIMAELRELEMKIGEEMDELQKLLGL